MTSALLFAVRLKMEYLRIAPPVGTIVHVRLYVSVEDLGSWNGLRSSVLAKHHNGQ